MPRLKSTPIKRIVHNLNSPSGLLENQISENIETFYETIVQDDFNEEDYKINDVWLEIPNSFIQKYIELSTELPIERNIDAQNNLCVGCINTDINCNDLNNIRLYECEYGRRLLLIFGDNVFSLYNNDIIFMNLYSCTCDNIIQLSVCYYDENLVAILFYVSRDLLFQNKVHFFPHLMSSFTRFANPKWLDFSSNLFNNTTIDKIRLEFFDSTTFLNKISNNSNEKCCNISDNQLELLSQDLQSFGLSTNLRKYQLQGIFWMFQRLTNQLTNSNSFTYGNLLLPIPNVNIENNIAAINTTQSKILYYNTVTHKLSYNQQSFNYENVNFCILADAMGLGKSIQILCLMLKLKNYGLSDLASQINHVIDEEKNKVSINETVCSCACKESYCPYGKNCNWIRCNSCNRWSHNLCEGYDRTSDIAKFTCHACKNIYYNKNPINSNATLIVLPDTLIQQWINEIQKHFIHNQLKIFIYESFNHQTLKSKHMNFSHISPLYLSTYDIIFIGFNTLKREFNEFYATDFNIVSNNRNVNERSRRNNTKVNSYIYYPPAIVCMKYLCIVVDETQKFESNNSKVLMLASRIISKYRVCLSGTPIGNNKISDLHNLLQFLHFNPFDKDISLWKSVFIQPLLPINPSIRLQWLNDIFSTFTMRRNKEDVIDQLHLYSKIYTVRYLEFSLFELALYKEQCEISRRKLKGLVNGINTSENDELAKSQLQLLRKGCCHPQVFDKSLYGSQRSTKNNGNVSMNGPRPFNEIMILKIEQSRIVCEEKLRQLLLQLYTMAGIEMINGDMNPNSKVLHYINALVIYQYADYVISRARFETDLVTLVRISLINTKDTHTYIGSYSTTSDNINLVWLIDNNDVSNSNNIEVSSVNLEKLNWVDTIEKALETRECIFDMKDISIIQVKLEFHQSHKITKLNCVSCNISSIIKDYTSNEDDVIVLMFPSKVNLLCSSGLDIFTLCCTYDLSLPQLSINDHNQLIQVPSSNSTTNYNNDYRSRFWRIIYPSFYSNYFVVIHKNSFMIWNNQVEILQKLFEKPLKLLLSNQINFNEPCYDVDLYQDLHLCTNTLHVIDTITTYQTTKEANIGSSTPAPSMNLNKDKSMTIDIDDGINGITSPSYYFMIYNILSNQNNKMDNLKDMDKLLDEYTVNSLDNIITNDMIDYIKDKTLTIKKHAEDIESRFLIATKARHHSSKLKLSDLSSDINKIEISIIQSIQMNQNDRDWWSIYLSSLNNYDLQNTMNSIKEVIVDSSHSYEKYLGYKNVSGLIYLLSNDFNNFIMTRNHILSLMNKLSSEPSLEEILDGSECKRCRSYLNKKGKVCKHCQLDDLINDYGTCLFTTNNHKINRLSYEIIVNDNEENNHNNIMDKSNDSIREIDSFLIMIIKQLKITSHRLYHHYIIDTIKYELNYWKAIRQEFSGIKNYWNRHIELLKAYDELVQCKQRMEKDYLDDYNTLADKYNQSYYIGCNISSDLETSIQSLNFYKSQEIQARESTKQRIQQKQNDSDNNESCVICQDDLSDGKIVVLPCAHIFHAQCIYQWIKIHNKCVICKRSTKMENISTVTNDSISPTKASPKKTNEKNSMIIYNRNSIINDMIIKDLNGSWGTKIDTLLVDIMLFLQNDEYINEKAIVFSQWTEMIEIVSQAMTFNNIIHCCCTNVMKDFKQFGSLDQFKSNPDIRILLLPIYLGAEGLDLIIASHIFLLEPLINSNIELQAINRIDRIGQRKQPHIIKYVILQTVEEKINITSTNISNNDNDIGDDINNCSNIKKSPKKVRSLKIKDDQINLSFKDIFDIVGDE